MQTAAMTLITGLGMMSAHAQTLMLDFGQTAVASPYLTLSPGHAAGAIALSDTGWNTITTSAVYNSLVYADGSAATGVSLSLGQEATGGDNTISFSTPILSLSLAGTGGSVPGQQSLLTAGSIYGDDSSSTAPGRDGFFGSGTATGTGAAIGLRLDGLAAGDYVLFVMGRNVNSDASTIPMNIFATTGASAGTFDFSSLSANPQSNIAYPAATYSGEYSSFVDGENYVGLFLSVGTGESVYLAVDGGDLAIDRRGFLNSFQIAPAAVPEPSAFALAGLGLAGLVIFRRRHP